MKTRATNETLLALMSCGVFCVGVALGVFVLVTWGVQRWVADDFTHGIATYGFSLVWPGAPIGIALIIASVLVAGFMLWRGIRVARSGE